VFFNADCIEQAFLNKKQGLYYMQVILNKG